MIDAGKFAAQRRVRRRAAARRGEGAAPPRKPHSRGFSTLGHEIMPRMNYKPPICYNCKKDGHLGKTCPMPKKPARKTCHHCGVFGHCIEQCPSSDLSRAYARRAVRLAASIDDTVLRNSAQASDSAILDTPRRRCYDRGRRPRPSGRRPRCVYERAWGGSSCAGFRGGGTLGTLGTLYMFGCCMVAVTCFSCRAY